jgi:serine/threonine protein phosphatase 1
MSILDRLLGRTPATPPATAALPPGTRVYAVGDIHGRLDLLKALRQLIHEDAYRVQAPRNLVIYLGDYVDRGDNSAQVLDLLIDEPLPGFESIHLLGNHESAMLRFLTEAESGVDWMAFGGDATLASYGIARPNLFTDLSSVRRAQDALLQKLPTRHLSFLNGLVPSHAEGDFFFVHAGVRPGTPLEHQSSEDLIWIRQPFLDSDADFGKVVVHGHTIEEKPVIRRNRIGIDTGAYTTGKLTSLVIQGQRYGFLQT